jgi:hypothetical protein
METESPETGRRRGLPYKHKNLSRKKISKQQKQNGYKQEERLSSSIFFLDNTKSMKDEDFRTIGTEYPELMKKPHS